MVGEPHEILGVRLLVPEALNFRRESKMTKKLAVPLLAVLAITLGAWSCNESSYRKANRAAKQLADDIHQFSVTVQTECGAANGHCTGELSDDETRALGTWAMRAAMANDEFIGQIQKTNAFQGPQSEAIVQAFNSLATAIGTSQGQAFLNVKSAKAKKEFQDISNGMQAAVALLQAIIAQQPAPTPAPQKSGIDPTLAITVIAALAKLIAQWRADGTLTDQQLQQAALAEDADTQNVINGVLNSLQNPPQ